MKTLSRKLAQAISLIFNPFLLGIIVVLIAVNKTTMNEDLKMAWYAAILIINGFIPAVVYFSLSKLGYVFDDSLDNIKVHRHRILLLASLLFLVTIEFLILVFSGGHQPLLAVFFGGMSTIILGIIITYFWKISWHSAGSTFFSAMFIFIYGWQFWYIFLMLILVIWSRLYLKRHTPWQLLAGVMIAFLVIFGTFAFYGLIK